jgi:hypothetical protein
MDETVLTATNLSSLLGRIVSRVEIVRVRVLEQSCVAEVDVDGEAILVKHASIEALRRVFPNKKDEAFSINELSFAAECAWAATAPTAALSAAGARVPLALGAVRSADGCFTTAQERLVGGWEEVRQFDKAHAQAALQWLAAFHAYFFTHAAERDRVVAAGAFGASVGGGWWRAAQRPTVDYSQAGVVFREHMAAMSEYAALGLRGDTDAALVDALGESARARHAAAAARRACDSDSTVSTLVHGDFKASNCFFDKNSLMPAAFDFQWISEASDGATDVAYLICGAVVYEALANGGADQLIAEYTQALRARLLEGGWSAGKAAGVANQVAERVEEEILCFWTTSLVYLLRGMNKELARENKHKYGWLTIEEDTRVCAWLAARAVRRLRREATL